MAKNYADLVETDEYGKSTYALDAPVTAEYSDDKFLFVWVSRGGFMDRIETAIFGFDSDMELNMHDHILMAGRVHLSDKEALEQIGVTLR